jgi:glycosyltransferase involved in cell wall biosynthesis
MLAKAIGGDLFEENSVNSLILSLRTIIEKSAELKAQGLAGADYVRRNYTWSASAERLEHIIKSRLCVME